jgi:hypothetical protein
MVDVLTLVGVIALVILISYLGDRYQHRSAPSWEPDDRFEYRWVRPRFSWVLDRIEQDDYGFIYVFRRVKSVTIQAIGIPFQTKWPKQRIAANQPEE